jgi:peptidoglycan/xylan/chitin deacetylase (PgdA/CDA1 family)
MSHCIGKTIAFRRGLKRGCASLYRHFCARREPSDLVILNYHSIQPREPYSTSPEMFARQLELLAEQFELLSLPAWLEQVERGRRASRPAALVSFDDGYENFYQFAYPVLQRFNAPALLFVATGFVAGGCGVEARLDMYRDLRPLSWAQLQELHRDGVTVGSHTHRHINLGQATPAQVAEELSHSRQLLEDHLGSPVTYFAYPWGQRRHIGGATIPLLRECGYTVACSTLWGKNTAETDPYLLRRVRIDPWDTLADFRAKIDGAWDFVGYYQRWR